MRPTLPVLLALSFLSVPAVACAGSRAQTAPSSSVSPADGSEAVAAKGAKKADKAAKTEGAVASKKGPQTGMTGPSADVATFRAAADAAKADPTMTAELFLKAMAAYVQERQLGLEMLAMLMPADDIREVDGAMVPNPFRQDEFYQLDKKPNVMQGYCGGTPDKQYTNANMKDCPIKFDSDYSKTRQGIGYPAEGKAKFFIVNGGVSRPRPIELALTEEGRWVVERYGLLSGVASPAE